MDFNEEELLNNCSPREALRDAELIVNIGNIIRSYDSSLSEEYLRDLSKDVFRLAKKQWIEKIKSIGVPKGDKEYVLKMNSKLLFLICEFIKKHINSIPIGQVNIISKELFNVINETAMQEFGEIFL